MSDSGKLAAFLRARRRITHVEDVGLPPMGGRRRTPGLRREEVAMLAGISIDYYARLEQGRERNPSGQVVTAIARALGLDRQTTAHLLELARPTAERAGPPAAEDEVDGNVLRLLSHWHHAPAYVVNHRLDVLAGNRAADALYEGLWHRDNLLRLALLDPAARDFYVDWERDTRMKVAHLRSAAGTTAEDPRLADLIRELSEASEDFRRMWDMHEVRRRTREKVRFRRPEVGVVHTTMEVLSVDGSFGQKIVVFQGEPGSVSERALASLARRGAGKPTVWPRPPDRPRPGIRPPASGPAPPEAP
ncbi:helix-turn-helix domain-containing protein [Microbispora sp. RL4-1S]|uniref:Helix-turn-helix domain-containing protein n=1 Tax=Microbispora oryzae TaxID=2806554 RepID=A0A941AJ97_9ACTN|nr:helix-turn-helix transcriptional regulator [Microbispora oryzae]MBP2703978.1 helix-turn-helix domain-containing protein [Microbispora oryzae]